MTDESVSDGANGEAVSEYREFFERSADAILIIEGETFVDCNQATVRMLRYDNKAQLLRTHPSQLSPRFQPDGRASFEKANEMIAIAFEKGSHRFEWDHLRADGELFPVEVLLTAVPQGDKKTLHVVWRDITDRRELESQLRHAQKMEAVGRLAGGVAHDFNNFLVAILGHTELIRQQLPEGAGAVENLAEVQRAAERAAELVRRLLAFSRKQELQPRVLDLNVVLRDLEGMVPRLIGEMIQLVTSTAPEPVEVLADPGQVEQVVINLVTNAKDAMPDGGTLSIAVSRVEDVAQEMGSTGGIEAGPWARLVVQDSGFGMDAGTVRRAFEPFFTTKEQGKGTGLGLATVYGIVQQNGGRVRIDSAPGRGTTVKIDFPITDKIDPGDTEKPGEWSSEGGSETILVAEDERAVSNLVVHVLESKGYHVLLARDGVEALEICRRTPAQIDLLLTDTVMPKLGGVALVQKLRKSGFDFPVLFSSGYSNDALSKLREVGEEVDLLEKPFTPAELVGRVRAALERS